MEVYCTRPGCPKPVNQFPDLDTNATLKSVQQKFCTTCGMPLILLGRYLPTKLLGKGGFGAAFLARDRYTPAMRQCVVKQFQPSGNLNPAQLKVAQDLFEREGEVLEQLGNRHPEIPDLLAFFELDVPSTMPGRTDRFFYLVQEYIDGQNMDDALEEKGKFSEAEIRELLVAILKILKFVHENGSIHRDIKPSNIMRHRDGRYYLLDFGAVKQVTAAQAVSGSGKSSTGIYSMGFAPLEQMSGNEVYASTDLYALGATCVTLLTGKPPEELFDAYRNVWDWRPSAQVSDRLANVLDRMLKALHSERFQSAEEVIEALNEPLPPPPPPPLTTPAPAVTPKTAQQPPTPPLPSAPPPVATAPAPSSTPASRFSLIEILGGAAFTGFEGSLLAIALISTLGTSLMGSGFWLGLLAILVGLQYRRVIERWDLMIIAVITFLVITVLPFLRDWGFVANLGLSSLMGVLVLAGLGALVAIAITILFQLVYRTLSNFF
jgi:serine/threonine protein kinase